MADNRDDMLLQALTDLIHAEVGQIGKKIDEKFNKLESKMDKRFEKIENRLEKVEEHLGAVEKRLDEAERQIKEMKSEILEVKICIEHELRPQIQTLYDVVIPINKDYKSYGKDIQDLREDMAMVKRVVAGHSEILERIS